MIEDIIEFNKAIDGDSLSNLLDLDDFNDIQLVEAAGTIFDEKWESFLDELYKDCCKYYNPNAKDEEENLFTLPKSDFDDRDCKFPGGKKFDYIMLYIDSELAGTTTLAQWAANDDKGIINQRSHAAVLKVNPDLLKNPEDEEMKDRFISAVLHEFTHGFNLQHKFGSNAEKKNWVNKAFRDKMLVAKKKDVEEFDPVSFLQFITYLYERTEQNARISAFGKEAMSKLKKNTDKEKYTYSEKGIKELIYDCHESLQLKFLNFYEQQLKHDVYKDFSCFMMNKNFIAFDFQLNGMGINDALAEMIGDNSEIVSLILYPLLFGQKFAIYNFKKRELVDANDEEKYNKIYDEVIRQTEEMNKKFYKRCVKVANHILLKYYESIKEKSKSDLRREKIEELKLKTQKTVICPKCGKECSALDLYCPECGKKLKDVEEK